MLNTVEDKTLIDKSVYAKKLRPLLPPEAFIPNPNNLVILVINLAILVLGWAIASNLDQWSPYLLWLYLPLSLVMGNSVMVMSFISHDFMHRNSIRKPALKRIISFLGFLMLWMPPTMWKAVHNREHHNKTNSLTDPDRNYLAAQPKTWGSWMQNLIIPSSEVNPIWFTIGMVTSWGLHTSRNISSVLLFNSKSVSYVPAAFQVSPKERRAIATELLCMVMIHLSIVAYLQFDPIKVVLSYLIPMAIGHAGIMFYIFTHHMMAPMTETNDPLINSVSLRVPKLVDKLHFNFSYHTEHHLFPYINSDYYPMVQELLNTHYPERMNLLSAGEAWRLLLQTPRHYKDESTFTDWSGEKSVPCPLQN